MKLDQLYRPDQRRSEESFSPLLNNFGVLALLPLVDNIDITLVILIAIIAGITLLFILITFVLAPISRRAKRREQRQREAEVETLPAQEIAPVVEGDTQIVEGGTEADLPIVPPVGEDGKETVISMPAIKTVGEPSTVPVSGKRPANIVWQIAGLTDVGLKRELNEDNMIMIEGDMDGIGPYGIYVVADGLGGHEAGEVASRLTVDAVQKQLDYNPPTANAAPFEEWLKDTIMMANEAVLNHQEVNVETRKMGSTMVMALIAGQNAHISNVGDSRAYHLNNESIKQISVDHSLVERLVQIGQITREEARTHKKRNVIYSIIGEKRRLEVGFYHVALDLGDRLLLCSDGLSGMVTDEELHHISKHQPDPAKASQIMVEAAKQAGGHDNITAVIVQMNES